MRKALLGALIGSIFLVVPTIVAAQSAKPSEPVRDENTQVLKALLEEIHLLRQDLQRANSLSQRLVVTLEGIRIEQSHLDALTQSLETVERHLAEMAATRSGTERELKESEDRISEASGDAKSILDGQIKGMKSQLEAFAAQEDQARQRQVALSGEIETTKNNLADLNKRVDTMMREFNDKHD
jgi:chromosome segregation ATPase